MIRKTAFYDRHLPWDMLTAEEIAEIMGWVLDGAKLNPVYGVPGSLKMLTVAAHLRLSRASAFVETGTFEGETTERIARLFPDVDVHTIEIMQSLHVDASRRLAPYPNVRCLLGDSSKLFAELLPSLPPRTLFWLDGHYSGEGTGRGDKETPIVEELRQIACRGGENIILVDDIRIFGRFSGYPTIEWIDQFVQTNLMGYTGQIYQDIARIYPKSLAPVFQGA